MIGPHLGCMILWKPCCILDTLLLTHLCYGPRTSTCLKQYSILIFIVLLWWFQCGGSKQFLLKLTKNFQIVSFKTPLDLQVIVTSFTCKIFGSQNSILYEQLISAKQFLLKFKKKFQIVSFKTPLDLQVIVTSFTCKIFELQNSILCQQLISDKQFLLK